MLTKQFKDKSHRNRRSAGRCDWLVGRPFQAVWQGGTAWKGRPTSRANESGRAPLDLRKSIPQVGLNRRPIPDAATQVQRPHVSEVGSCDQHTGGSIGPLVEAQA